MGEELRRVWQIIARNKTKAIRGKDIQKILEEQGYHYDIKTIYNMIKQLNLFFEPIIGDTFIEAIHSVGYTINQNIFEDGQLQLILDGITYNKDLSHQEKKQLIDKLLYFSSSHQVERLILHEQVDEKNFSLMINLSVIMKAIQNQKNIYFEYVSYDIKEGHPIEVASQHGNENNGKNYLVSPYTIIIDNNHYYLLGYFNKYKDTLTTYRIDRMRKVRTWKKSFIDIREQYDLNDYVHHNFNMFVNGKETTLRIQFHKAILREIVSQFGEDIYIIMINDNWYEAVIKNIHYTKGLMNWILMLGSKIKVIGPTHIKKEIEKEVQETLALYQKQRGCNEMKDF